MPDHDALVRFARRISHDLNNFSTVVRTYSELLLADLPEGEPMREDLQEVHRAADATVEYLQRVTQFARIGHMRRSVVPISDGIEEAVAVFGAAHPSRAVSTVLEGGFVFADAQWWRTVVRELLLNAHEAAPADTSITVRSHLSPHTITVEVEDAGPGVADAIRETVTQPFVTTKEGVRGAGVGLATVDAFVRALDGRLTFERRAQSTVIALALPCVEGPA